jgi:hypothetical protein
MFLLSRENHKDKSILMDFMIKHGIAVQHVICFPLYCAFLAWVALVAPSCFMYYAQVKALHQYIVNMLIVFLAYYGVVILCMVQRPQMAAALTLVVSVHILEKCMVETGERILFIGAKVRKMFEVLALGLIGFAWLYLPIHTTSSMDFVCCLFAAEVIGICIVCLFHLLRGFGAFLHHCYDIE